MQFHLFLFVKVRENWGDDPERYREMGLEFPEEMTEEIMTASPLNLRKRFTAYRYLTGPDDSSFCHRVTGGAQQGLVAVRPADADLRPRTKAA